MREEDEAKKDQMGNGIVYGLRYLNGNGIALKSRLLIIWRLNVPQTTIKPPNKTKQQATATKEQHQMADCSMALSNGP